MSSYEQKVQQTASAALGTGWAALAGLLLLASGALQAVEGIAGLAKNHFFAETFFWGKPFWGVVFLVVAGMSVYAAFAVLNRLHGARTIGVLVALVGLVVQVMAGPGLGDAWSLPLIAIALLVMYALVARGEAATPPHA
jgi:hypothetical protein